tara:strand:- start:165 stop:350 length:186 start_codon:yes stop_codon:yes gene_type:complete
MANTKYLYHALEEWYNEVDYKFDQSTDEKFEELREDSYFDDIFELCEMMVKLKETIKSYND